MPACFWLVSFCAVVVGGGVAAVVVVVVAAVGVVVFDRTRVRVRADFVVGARCWCWSGAFRRVRVPLQRPCAWAVFFQK